MGVHITFHILAQQQQVAELTEVGLQIRDRTPARGVSHVEVEVNVLA